MSNPTKEGRLSKLYYQIGDFDTTQTEDLILADASWIELCGVTEVGIPKSRNLRAINDRCAPDDVLYTKGRRDQSITFTFNSFRHDKSAARAWDTAVDNGDIIAIMALDDDRTEAGARGFVMNAIAETLGDETQPEDGENTEAYAFRPSAETAFTPRKRLYGADWT